MLVVYEKNCFGAVDFINNCLKQNSDFSLDIFPWEHYHLPGARDMYVVIIPKNIIQLQVDAKLQDFRKNSKIDKSEPRFLPLIASASAGGSYT